MNMDSNKFVYLVRDLFRGRLTEDYQHISGFLDNTSVLKIKCVDPHNVVAIDSLSVIENIQEGDVIEIKRSEFHLPYLFIQETNLGTKIPPPAKLSRLLKLKICKNSNKDNSNKIFRGFKS